MQNRPRRYVQLIPDGPMPDLGGIRDYRAIVVVEAYVDEMWRWDVSRWLVASGCKYMLAWGPECSSWDDSVDEANLEAANYEDMPEQDRVMSTWHEDEDLEEVFWFAKTHAKHPICHLNETVILHISETNRHDEILSQFDQA